MCRAQRNRPDRRIQWESKLPAGAVCFAGGQIRFQSYGFPTAPETYVRRWKLPQAALEWTDHSHLLRREWFRVPSPTQPVPGRLPGERETIPQLRRLRLKHAHVQPLLPPFLWRAMAEA